MSQGTWLSSHRRSGTWTAQAGLCLGRGSARRVVTSRSCRVHHCCSERFVLAPYSRQYAWWRSHCRSHWTCACCSHCMISKTFNVMSQLHCTSSLIREHGRSDVHGMIAWLAKGGQGRPHSQSPACLMANGGAVSVQNSNEGTEMNSVIRSCSSPGRTTHVCLVPHVPPSVSRTLP